MPPRGEKREKLIVDSSNSTPTWMVTLGDTMSLLLCFFVLLLTFSDLSSDELTDVFGFFSGSSGVISRRSRLNTKQVQADNKKQNEVSPVMLRFSEIPARRYETERRLSAQGFDRHITIKQLEYGLVITIDEDALFDANQRLAAPGQAILREVVNLFNAVQNEIRLIAAQSNRPEGLQKAQLKSAAVAEFLIDSGQLQRERFGFGSTLIDGQHYPANFEIHLMEKVGTEKLRIADLWNEERWQK